MDGGTGDDIYDDVDASDVISEANQTDGIDTIRTTLSYSLNVTARQYIDNLTLTGSGNVNGTGNAIANVITGNSGNNTLNGGAGDDILEGGLGNDTLIGSSQTTGDTASYEHAGSAVTVTLALTTAQDTGGAGTDIISQVENLTGSAFNDVLTGTGA